MHAACMKRKNEVNFVPRNKYPEETEKKILEASLKLFLEKGYEQTTVLDIIAQLGGLTRGAFYHHFKSKEAVLEALIEKVTTGDDPIKLALAADVPNGLARVRYSLKLALNSNVATAESAALIGMALALLAEPGFFAHRHRMNMEVAERYEPMIQEGMEDGSIRKGSAKILTELLVLMLNHWLLPNLFPCTPEELHAKVKMMRDTLEAQGAPIIDDEIEEIILSVVDALKTT